MGLCKVHQNENRSAGSTYSESVDCKDLLTVSETGLQFLLKKSSGAIVNHAHLHIPSIKVWHRVNHSLGMYVHIHKVALRLSSF